MPDDPNRTRPNNELELADIRNLSRCHRAILASIGQELRASYDLPQGLPHRMLALLLQINEPKFGSCHRRFPRRFRVNRADKNDSSETKPRCAGRVSV